jgi:hypothetical protein
MRGVSHFEPWVRDRCANPVFSIANNQSLTASQRVLVSQLPEKRFFPILTHLAISSIL